MTAQAFWDRHAPKYSKQPIADPTAYEEKLRRVTTLLRPSDRVLEIGCGTGGTARHLARFAGAVTATDLSPQMIRIANARSDDAPTPRPVFLQADAAQDLGAPPFDMVCAFSLLHLVEDIPGLLAVVRDQVKPGGYFVSKTVCLSDGPLWMRWMVHAMMKVGLAPKVAIISRAQLTRHLVAAGFEIDEVRYLGASRINPFVVARKSVM